MPTDKGSSDTKPVVRPLNPKFKGFQALQAWGDLMDLKGQDKRRRQDARGRVAKLRAEAAEIEAALAEEGARMSDAPISPTEKPE